MRKTGLLILLSVLVGCAAHSDEQLVDTIVATLVAQSSATYTDDHYTYDPSPRNGNEDPCAVQQSVKRSIKERNTPVPWAEIIAMVERGVSKAWYYEHSTDIGHVVIVDLCNITQQQFVVLITDEWIHYIFSHTVAAHFQQVTISGGTVQLTTKRSGTWTLKRGVLVDANGREYEMRVMKQFAQ